MISRSLLIGASALALSAGPAAAQTVIVGTNESSISQTGLDNFAAVNNTAAGNDDNRSSVIQNGIANSATVEQVGDLNNSRVAQLGNDNQVTHREIGNRNTADTQQTGNNHVGTVLQQGDDHFAAVIQSNGNRNGSTINQGVSASNAGAAVPAFRNFARVQQLGSDNSSTVNQRAGSDTVSGTQASDNSARVVQGIGSLLSNGNASSITQSSRGNSAEVFMYEGSVAARNQSTIAQSHNNAVNTAQPGAGTLSSNRASVAIRGYGNRSTVSQNGRNNIADVTLQGGGTAAGAATDAESGRTQGNLSELQQSGTGLTATVVQGTASRSDGQGNRGIIAQSGNGHHAETWQRGLYDTSNIIQGDGSQAANITYSNGVQARSFATLAQKGERGDIQVQQYGDNFAEVTQGLGARSAASVYQVDAGDLGVSATATDPANRAQNRAAISQYGDFQVGIVRQYALNASADVYQQAGPAGGRSHRNYVLIEQGMADVATIAAGSPGESAFFGSGPSGQSGPNSRNLSASVVQGNGGSPVSYNRATVRQDGVNLKVIVDQAGTGAPDAQNGIAVAQRGSDNNATAIQRAGVGPSGAGGAASGQSGDEFYFAGGRRSAEIVILQKNSGNSALVEQRGLGQVARVEQSGARNGVSIMQDVGATNATAVIRQSGNDNSYTVAQTQAGQYLVVSQTGNSNAVTNVVQRP
jgi:hypothetical protein